MQLDVFAGDADAQALVDGAEAGHDAPPIGQILFVGVQLQPLHDVIAEAAVFDGERHGIDVVGCLQGDDGVFLDIAEERDFAHDIGVDGMIGAGDDDIGLDADAAQFADAVLGGFGLQLVGRADMRQEGDMDNHGVFALELGAQLAQRLEEGQTLNIAGCAADFDDDDISARSSADQLDAALDLVGDMRHYLDRAAEVIAFSLFLDDGEIDLPGCDIA